MLELAVLGPPLLTLGGQRVAPPTRKALALLAYVAIDGPAPRARLADVFWPSVDPEKARGNLRRELNRLRHTPLGGELVSEGSSLALREPFGCDVREFLRSADSRDWAAALSVYRGPLLDGFELYDADDFDDWLARRRAALAERQRAALAHSAEALEAAGDLRGALQAHLDLLRLDETQELYHREAMRLHHLLGEREAALECFARLKRVLGRELALEPLPETVALARAVRSAQHVPEASVPGRGAIPVEPPLIGRTSEWKALSRGDRRLVVLIGEAGVGKTRLAIDFARGTGAHVVARASEVTRTTAFYPLSLALRSALDDSDARRRLAALAPVYRREAARLVPEIEPDTAAESITNEARARFVEAVARALAAAVGPRGIVILDDLHWFDVSSVELAAHLVRRSESLGVRVVATARPAELGASPAASAIAALERDGLASTLPLDPLAPAEVLALLRALARTRGAERFAERLHAATGGNPLFIVETLRSMVAQSALTIDDGGWHTSLDEVAIAPGMRDTVVARVERLGPAVRRLLEAASLVGARFALEDLEGATGLGPFEAVDALEHALGAGLLEREGEAIRFHHDLVRRALADGLGVERRKLLHHRLAESLARRGGAAATVADHLTLAGRAAAAIPFRLRAGEDALKVFAYSEALDQYAAALACDLSPDQAFEVRGRRVAIHRVLDDRSAWGAEVEALAAIAGERGGASLGARAALARSELDNSRGRYAEALDHADAAALAAGADAAALARALLEGGRALLNLGRAADARARLERALASAPEAELEIESDVHRALHACAIEENDLAAAQTHNDEARRVAEAREDRHGLALARMNDGTIRRRAGDLAGAVSHLDAAWTEAREAGLVALERSVLLALASAHNLLGDYDQAATLAEHGIELAKQPEDPQLEARFSNALAAFEYSRGNLASSIAHSERAISVASTIAAASWSAFFRYGLAHTFLELGAHERARAVIEEAQRAVEELHISGQHVVLETHLAHVELLRGEAGAAAQRIEQALASGAPPSLDADYTFAVLAVARLRSGDPTGALRTVEQHPFRPIHRSRALGVAIEARLALGRTVAEPLAQARTLLADPCLTPVESLELRRAVARALDAVGDADGAGEERAAAARLVMRLLASLEASADLRGCFEAHNADLCTR